MSGVTGILLSYGSAVPPPYVPPTPSGGWDFVLSDVDTAIVTASWDWDGGTQLDPQAVGPFASNGSQTYTSGYDQLFAPNDRLVVPYNSQSGSYGSVSWGSNSRVWRAGNAIPLEGGAAVSIDTGLNFTLWPLPYTEFYVQFPFNANHYTGQDGCSIAIKPYSGGVIQRSAVDSETLISYGGTLGITANISGPQGTDTGGVILYAWVQAVYVAASRKLYLKKYMKPYMTILNTPDLEVSGSRLGVFETSTSVIDYYSYVDLNGTGIYIDDQLDAFQVTYPGAAQEYDLPFTGFSGPYPQTGTYEFYDILIGWQYYDFFNPVEWMINFQKILDDYPALGYVVTTQEYADTAEEGFSYTATMFNGDYLAQDWLKSQDPGDPTQYYTAPTGGFYSVGGTSVDTDTASIPAASLGYVRGFFQPYTNTWKFFVEDQATQDYPYKQIWTTPNLPGTIPTLTQPVTNYLVETGANTSYNVCWYKIELVPNPAQSYIANITATVINSSVNPVTGVNDALVMMSDVFPSNPKQTVNIPSKFVSKFAEENVIVYVAVGRGNMYYAGWAWADGSVNVANTLLTITITTTPSLF